MALTTIVPPFTCFSHRSIARDEQIIAKLPICYIRRLIFLIFFLLFNLVFFLLCVTTDPTLSNQNGLPMRKTNNLLFPIRTDHHSFNKFLNLARVVLWFCHLLPSGFK